MKLPALDPQTITPMIGITPYPEKYKGPVAKRERRVLGNPCGIKSFGVKVAHVEMKNGGVIEEGFSPTAEIGGKDTIRHRIIAYLPERLLVLRNEQTPPGLPHAELYRNVVQVIAIEPRGKGKVRLTISHTGYGSGADYDELYAFFRTHNPEFLTGAKKTCESSKP